MSTTAEIIILSSCCWVIKAGNNTLKQISTDIHQDLRGCGGKFCTTVPAAGTFLVSGKLRRDLAFPRS